MYGWTRVFQHQAGRAQAYLCSPSSQSHQTTTRSSSKGHRHAGTPGAQTGCLRSPEGLQPLPSHPTLKPPTPLLPQVRGIPQKQGGQMRACSSPLLVHTIFSWAPARAQGTSTRSQGSHTVLPQGMNALCQFKAKSLGLFQFKSCFSTCVPFPFAARSAKGPISPHCIGTA